MNELEDEYLFREDLFATVLEAASLGDGTLSRASLGSFQYQNMRLRLIDPQGGIWNPGPSWPLKPELRATLSINTTLSGTYEDREVSNGLWRYDYQSGGSAGKNSKLRKAKDLGLPLLWFRQQPNRKYLPYRVFVLEDFPDLGFCHIAPDRSLGELIKSESAIEQRYATRLMKQRLHQPAFRARVLDAYKIKCAICKLSHGSLLDAAHITPDSDDSTSTAVSNGLSLCKIHHRSYDVNLLGIDSSYRIHIREDILLEQDGPMLEHGIKAMHNQILTVPIAHTDKPDRDRLAARFEKFKAQ